MKIGESAGFAIERPFSVDRISQAFQHRSRLAHGNPGLGTLRWSKPSSPRSASFRRSRLVPCCRTEVTRSSNSNPTYVHRERNRDSWTLASPTAQRKTASLVMSFSYTADVRAADRREVLLVALDGKLACADRLMPRMRPPCSRPPNGEGAKLRGQGPRGYGRAARRLPACEARDAGRRDAVTLALL